MCPDVIPPPFTEMITRWRSATPSINGMIPSIPRSIPFFVAASRHRPDPIKRPPLELILVAIRQVLRTRQIHRLADHANLVLQFRERVFHPAADEIYREIRDVNADPFALVLLGRMHRRPATAERI